nr:RecName: Full=Uncharacterized shell protein 26; AltName: Full=BMSP-like protein [Lottia gigantea]
ELTSVAGSGRVDSTPLGSRGVTDLERGSFDVTVDKTNIGPLDYNLRAIKMRSKRSLSRPQAIISNCNGVNGEGPSIMVSGGPDYVTFSIKTSNTVRPAQLTIPARPGYNDVSMIYDGQNLKAKVNDIARSIPLTGKIEMRQAGLLFGACNGYANFRGEVDDFEMYECIPPFWG